MTFASHSFDRHGHDHGATVSLRLRGTTPGRGRRGGTVTRRRRCVTVRATRSCPIWSVAAVTVGLPTVTVWRQPPPTTRVRFAALNCGSSARRNQWTLSMRLGLGPGPESELPEIPRLAAAEAFISPPPSLFSRPLCRRRSGWRRRRPSS